MTNTLFTHAMRNTHTHLKGRKRTDTLTVSRVASILPSNLVESESCSVDEVREERQAEALVSVREREG